MQTITLPSPPQVSRRTTSHSRQPLTLRTATEADRQQIYRIRHEVYALEIGQHAPHPEERLTDSLDDVNVYLVAVVEDEVAGFVSITPPSAGKYSVEKYFVREFLPFPVHHALYEVRLLTVLASERGSDLAAQLMYAALRWVEAHGGTEIMAIGREEVLSVYLKAGLQNRGMEVQAREVTYHLLHAKVASLRQKTDQQSALLSRMERHLCWEFPFPFRKPAACFHGGAFFDAVGPKLDRLESAGEVINADVLDAWYPPAPAVLELLEEHLPWLMRTSPPTACEGLSEVIAEARRVPVSSILPGAGSSDLIFRAMQRWLTRSSRVLLLDPTYGEYAHIFEKVIGCQVERLSLRRERQYEVPTEALVEALRQPYDLVVLVNPNSPTGRHIPRSVLAPILAGAHPRTRIWIDETYVDFVNPAQSLESIAAQSENLIVCKSMSKAYALSGARAAYLCAGTHQLEELRAWTPPWVVSLPAQAAAIRALQSPAYYIARWSQTRELREQLAAALRYRGFEVIPGSANFLLTHLRDDQMPAEDFIRLCRGHGLFLRDAARMGSRLGDRAVRFAVKDPTTQRHMLTIVDEVLR